MGEEDLKQETVYTYPRKYVLKDGTIKTYDQKVVRFTEKKELDKVFRDGLNEILKSSVTLNKLNRIRKTIVKNKCYGKKNFLQSVNKIDQTGELGEETRELMNKCFRHQYDIAKGMEDNLKLLLTLYENEVTKMEELNKELSSIDEEVFEAK